MCLWIEIFKIFAPFQTKNDLKEAQINIIDDNAFSTLKNCFIKYNVSNLKKSSKTTYLEYITRIFNLIKIFNPHSSIWIIWGFIHMIASIPAVFLMPIEFISDG